MMSQIEKSYVNIKSHSAPNTSAKEWKLICLKMIASTHIILGYKIVEFSDAAIEVRLFDWLVP